MCRKTPRIKGDKDRTSKRYNLQHQNSLDLSTALPNSKFITPLSTSNNDKQQTAASSPLSPTKSDEGTLDERLEKKRREREL